MKISKNDDLAMINNPNKWPCWPYLPLKRRNNALEDKNLGVLIDGGLEEKVIYHVYLFDLPKTPDGWKDLTKTTYSSTEELLKDGWIVD